MKSFRALSLVGAGVCLGAFASIGLQAYAAKQAAEELPLQEIRQFTSVFNAVKDYYVDPITDKELLQSAVEGMVSGLDPHSNFLDQKGFEDMNESTHGAFGGLGLEVTKDPAGVRVISPIDDTPAARAGVRAGDIITKIDGEAAADLTLEDAVKLMRGEPKTKVKLEVARKGVMKPLHFELERAMIKTQSVKMQKLIDGIGYIRITQFQERTAEDLAKHLNDLEKAGNLKGLVLDLRNDPGGLLQAAIGVSAAFLPKNADIVSTKGRAPQSDYVFKAIESDYRAGNAVRALEELNSDWTASQEIADRLMRDHGLPFRIGHHLASRMVSWARANNVLPKNFPYEQMRRIYKEEIVEEFPEGPQELPMSEAEFLDALDPRKIIANRKTIGSASPFEVDAMRSNFAARLKEETAKTNALRLKVEMAIDNLQREFAQYL